MINITALSSIYLLMFFAFGAGILSLTENNCSDWLTTCPGAEVTTVRPSNRNSQPDLPDDPEDPGPAGRY